MTTFPVLTGKRIITALGKAGSQTVRNKGSHHFLQHPDGRATVVSVHSGETIGPGLLTKILRDCEMSRNDLTKLL